VDAKDCSEVNSRSHLLQSKLYSWKGGVLLTNGWDNHIQKHVADKFCLDYDEMNDRHHLTFDTYEEGKLSLDEYLNQVVFYQERSFSRKEFKTFMYAQS
jgi:putative hydrolase of the HAD superfamily